MSRFLPRSDEDDEFAWQCASGGHWNRRDESMCRVCRDPKPEQPEVLRELLERISEQHPRDDK
jgi:hypothetical protein